MRKIIIWFNNLTINQSILLIYLFMTFIFMGTSLILGTDEWIILQCLVGIYVYLYRKETFGKKEADNEKG